MRGQRPAPASADPPLVTDRVELRRRWEKRKAAGLKSRALGWDNRHSAWSVTTGERRLPLSSAQSSPPALSTARNGNRCSLVIPGLPDSRAVRPRGDRGACSGFSKRSRRALLDLVNSINRGIIDAACVRFVTLTYPDEFPTARASKRHLDTLFKRFERHWGRRAIVWKIEDQKRGAPHFHLLVVMPAGSSLEAEQAWWASAWFEVVGSGDARHLKWHLGQLGNGNRPCVESVRDWQTVINYAGKYLCKLTGDEGETWDRPGRFWGVRRGELLGIIEDVVELSPVEAVQVKRCLRRWYEKQSSGFVYCPGQAGAPGLRLHRSKVDRRLVELGACRVQRRRWRRASGGISVYLADPVVRRLVEFIRGGRSVAWSEVEAAVTVALQGNGDE